MSNASGKTTERGRVFSIGHSNHSLDKFLTLLKKHNINLLIDVRSHPYSKFASHFTTDCIQEALTTAGIQYLFLGRELGGRPEEREFYDSEGHVLYWKLANSSKLKEGIRRLEEESKIKRVAIMCSEEDPSSCHRRLLVGRVLTSRRIEIDHIRGNGQVQEENDLVAYDKQHGLFDQREKTVWRSIQSVLHRGQRQSSSEH
jgi:uncharacterized protein (DUF488 family)